MNWQKTKEQLITGQKSIAPLVIFRILFGLLMLFSLIRFIYNGWVEEFYIQPGFTFTFYGFDWVQPLPGNGMYLVFGLMIVSCLLIITGAFYRLASVLFFLLFTYVEMIDKTYYLNHYYFISLVSFIMIWLPANARFSFDVKWGRTSPLSSVPAWTLNILLFQIGTVYFFAGIAKINHDWLFEALPLKIWLQAFTWWPVVGDLFASQWTAYFFSWSGMLYDVFIVFFLLYPKTRLFAYGAVIFFHGITGLMFPIGVFPYVMISLTLLFFDQNFHERILSFLEKFTKTTPKQGKYCTSVIQSQILTTLFTLWVIVQLALPFRYLLYDGPLFWTEEGYRFSWRVMLMEKTGMCTFFIKENDDSAPVVIDNLKYLTRLQEHMMATQPDMILQYAHFLEKEYKKNGMEDPGVYADCIVSLQGNRSKPFIDKNIDLSSVPRGFSPKKFILSYD